jgi:group I intron endonuclease
MDKSGGIYRILINDKPYIGSTVNFTTRHRKHMSALRLKKHSNAHLQNAWNKYGENSFKFEIIEVIENPNKQSLEQKEQYWLDYYDSANSEKGYNIYKKAYSTAGLPAWNKGKSISEETKQKISLARLGKQRSPFTVEHKHNMRLCRLGKPLSEEHKNKLRLINLTQRFWLKRK